MRTRSARGVRAYLVALTAFALAATLAGVTPDPALADTAEHETAGQVSDPSSEGAVDDGTVTGTDSDDGAGTEGAGTEGAGTEGAGTEGAETENGGGDRLVPMADSVRERIEVGESTDLWLVFEDTADLDAASGIEDWGRRGEAVVRALRATAEASQREAVAELEAAGVAYHPHWITNRIFVPDADAALVERLADDPRLLRIAEDAVLEQVEPSPGTLAATLQAVEWGIAAINADDVWDEFGVQGEGITVASIDGGVDFRHPALVETYRGNLGDGVFDHDYHWFDADGRCPQPEPCDDPDGHGTHTMGTMVGDGGDGNRIGVAPKARWIAANGCCPSMEALVRSAEWMLAPTDLSGENPRPELRPHIINNSWGSSNGSQEDPMFDDILQAWTAAGIFHTFAIGNSGPQCDTAASPGDSTYAYGVGGFASDGTPYESSSRGPGGGDEIKPNISAPAVNVRSSLPGGEYGAYSGTSMAAPHVAGTVALMWSAAPALLGDVAATQALLAQTAVDQAEFTCGGTPENNNTWGEGRLDAFAAVQASPRGSVGRLEGTVTDAVTGEPLEGAVVSAEGASSRRITTGPDGRFGAPLTAGEYTLTVERYGYEPGGGDVTITADTTVTVDLPLNPADAFAVSGVVTTSDGTPVQGASVTLEGTPLPEAVTDADGRYAFEEVPAGAYRLLVTTPYGCSDDTALEVVVRDVTVADVELPDRIDAFGYRCVVEPSAYLDAGPDAGGEEVPLTGDDRTVAVELPFPVWFYGTAYDTAYVSTNGHLNFLEQRTDYTNLPIPDDRPPNAAIYPFWDDLVLDEESRVGTRVVGEGDARRFVVEWRDATFYGREDLRVSFEVIVDSTGDIALAWRGLDEAEELERGSAATVGIENESGTVGLQYAANRAVLSDDLSVRFTLPPNGFLFGTAVDRNDGNPIGNATVTVRQAGEPVATLLTEADGTFHAQLWTGTYTAEVAAGGYRTRSATVTIRPRRTTTTSLTLPSARAVLTDLPTRWVLPPDGNAQASVRVANTGSAPLRWSVVESGGGPVPAETAGEGTGHVTVPAPGPAAVRTPAPKVPAQGEGPPLPGGGGGEGVDEQARTNPESAGHVRPFLAGEVLSSWPAGGMENVWGVGYRTSAASSGEAGVGEGEVWVGDALRVRNHGFTPSGVRTTDAVPVPWAANWQADFAFDSRRDVMCQVNVGGDNGIHCFDPETGEADYRILGYPWDRTSQRGLAYRPDDDTFYIGGWNDDVLYHVAGRSHDRQGEVLGSCPLPDIAGLAWDEPSGTLWVTTSTLSNDIHQVDPEDCSILASISGPDPAAYSLAGVELDHAGHLWLGSQEALRVYQVDGDQRADVSWLRVSPSRDRVAPGEEARLDVRVDATGLPPGVYRAAVVLETNAGRRPVVAFPVEIVVSASWTGINAGDGGAYTDVAGTSWLADRAYTEGAYGWVGASRTRTAPAKADIAETDDDPLYRSLREGMTAYRLDDLPGGTYEVTLGFAEPARSPRVDRRVFDVDLNGDYVLVGHDVARSAGGRAADQHTFTVELEEGADLVIGFHRRRGYAPPIVNAIRVVHRPDL